MRHKSIDETINKPTPMIPVLKFTTYFKPVIWGGERIARFKRIPSQGTDIGESWELSPMPGHESVVADGPYEGMTLNSLVAKHPEEILGRKVNARWHGKFLLLVKIIDSNDDLSIQVHPDDKYAAEHYGKGSLGKTEMWYSIDPQPGAYLYAGFNRPMDAATFKQMIDDNSIVDALAKFDVVKGDFFYLPAGRVHAIGKGNLVVEIQEASDTTYRIYDYDRRDSNGNPRELHVDRAKEVVSYDDIPGEKENIIPPKGEEARLADCEYFTAAVRDIDKSVTLETGKLDSFTILISIDGDMTVTTPDGHTTPLPQGHTLLIPACQPSISITGSGKILTAHL